MPPTKDEIQAENDKLKERIAELEATGAKVEPGTANPPRTPQRPDFGLSAGEADDLRNNGVTTSPFNGQQLNALDEGIEPATDEARRNAELAQKRKRAAAGAPLAGPPPAEGGPTGAGVATGDVAATQDS